MKRLLKGVGLGVLLHGIVLYIVPLFFPLPGELENPSAQGVVFLDDENRVIRRLLQGDLRSDAPATYEEFPTSLIEATLAAEDSRFYRHNGIDYLGTMRSLRDAINHGRFTSGASTITQQTIKIYSPTRKRNFRTKVIETFSARKLEMFASKEEILTAYLNRLPYGNQLTGARAAARGYFGKPLEDLSTAESALLAGLPNKPSKLNPVKNFSKAVDRQLWILQRMEEENFLTSEERRFAAESDLTIKTTPGGEFLAPHFTEHLFQTNPGAIHSAGASGAPVQTTLNLKLQQFVENTVSTELSRIAPNAGGLDGLQAAVVVIENETGSVKVLTGSRSFSASRSGQINGAWTPRSAGSTLKPFTYLLALENGFTAATILADTPIEYVTATGSYQPVNFDRRFNGPVSLRHSLANSLNVPAVKILNEIGGPEALFHCLQDDLHLSSFEKGAAEYGLGLTLGNAEVRLLELTNAYATLARLGAYLPYRFLDTETPPNPIEVFDRNTSWLIADILSDNQARAGAFGVQSYLQLPFQVAAKTGTSTDFRDNWTLGFTPEFTVGVWVGRFDNRPLKRLSGAAGAAPIFHAVMKELHRDKTPQWFRQPAQAKQKFVDRWSGKPTAESLSLPDSRLRKEWFLENLPNVATLNDYDSKGRTLLSSAYSEWLHENESIYGEEVTIAKLSPETRPRLRIVSPLEGTVALLDPDLPASGSRFPLRVAGIRSASVIWSSSTLSVESEGEESWVILKPGTHRVVAKEKTSGTEITSEFEVRAL